MSRGLCILLSLTVALCYLPVNTIWLRLGLRPEKASGQYMLLIFIDPEIWANIGHIMAFLGRKKSGCGKAYHLREPQLSYRDFFDTKNVDIGAENR